MQPGSWGARLNASGISSGLTLSNPFKQFKPGASNDAELCCTLTLRMATSFHCGGNVDGKIEIEHLDKYWDARICVDVKLTGWLKIQFTDVEEQLPSSFRNGFFLTRRSNTIQYKNHRKLLRLKERVFDGVATEHAPMLCIPFTFDLPMDIPGSFHGKCGQIKYYLEAEIQFGSRQNWIKHKSINRCITIHQVPVFERMDVLKKTCLQSTTISQTKDLLFKKGYYYDEVDTSEQAPLSSILSTSQQSCSKRVRCTVSLPKHYYTPGELVSIDVSILNEASITLDKILVELISIEEYDATGRGKDCKTVIRETRQMEKCLEQVGKKQKKSWSNVYLSKLNSSQDYKNGDPIPNLSACMKIPKDVHGCGFRLSYRLRIRLLEQQEIEETLLWEQKILIGAVPLVDDYNTLQLPNLPPLRKGSARENNERGLKVPQLPCRRKSTPAEII